MGFPIFSSYIFSHNRSIVREKFLIPIAALLMVIQACSLRTDLSEIQDWSPEIAAPLIYGETTLGDLVNLFDSLAWLRIEPDGQFFLHLERELVSAGSPDLFDIPDFTEVYDTSSTSTVFPLFALDKGIVRTGNLTYLAYYSQPDPAVLTVDFESVFEPGGVQPFAYADTIPGAGFYQETISLDGLEIIPEDLFFRASYQLRKLSDGSPVLLDSLRINYTDLALHYAEGTFPGYEFTLDSGEVDLGVQYPDDLPFPILTNPAIELIIENEFGVPNELQATRLELTYPDGNTIQLMDSNLTEGFSLAYPTVPGESEETRIRLDRTNSNLDDLVAALPTTAAYGGRLTLFPDSMPTTGFVIDTATVTVNVLADFPLEFRAEPWSYEQWFDWDSLSWENSGSAEFRLETRNGFPVEVQLELFAADQDSTILTSFFNGPISLDPPALSPEGRALSPSEQVQFFSTDQEFLETLGRTTLILARMTLSTPQGGQVPIQLYSQDLFGFKLGVRYQQ